MKFSETVIAKNGQPIFRLPVRLSGLSDRADNGRPLFAILAATAAALLCTLLPVGAQLLLPSVCALMLIIGLPHGIFDYLTLRKLGRGLPGRTLGPLAIYCAAALLTWTLWQTSPLLSLALFLVVAIVHFAEDWMQEKPRLGAAAMAVSLIALPSILYPAELGILLSAVAGVDAGILSDCLRLIAPVFALVALAHVIIDAGDGAAPRACRNLALLLAAIALPPAIGFAVYFCVYHSPMHFAEGKTELLDYDGKEGHFFAAMMIACVFAVAFVFMFQPHHALDKAIVASTFQTLSILTVPHMLLSYLIARSKQRQLRL